MAKKRNPIVDPLGKAAQKQAAIICALQNRVTMDILEIGRILSELNNDLGDDDFVTFVRETLGNGWTIKRAYHYIAKAEQFSSWTNAEWNKLGSSIKYTLFQIGIPNAVAQALQRKAASLLGTVRTILRPTYESIYSQNAPSKTRKQRLFRDDATLKSLPDKKLKGGIVKCVEVTDNGIGGKVEQIKKYDRKNNVVYFSIKGIVNGQVVESYEGLDGNVSVVAIKRCFGLL